jgi:hypothetical protein
MSSVALYGRATCTAPTVGARVLELVIARCYRGVKHRYSPGDVVFFSVSRFHACNSPM